MTEPFPMKAAKAVLRKIQYPVLGFPKIDGIRGVIHNKQALSCKLIALPNLFIQGFFSNDHFQGLDGELVVGSPTDPLCIKHTTSGVMSVGGVPDFTYYVFDQWDMPERFAVRFKAVGNHLTQIFGKSTSRAARRVRRLQSTLLKNEDDLLVFEEAQILLGYEGIVLRDPNGAYKHGRSTALEGGMLKLKRFEDSEALVLAVVEEQYNGNAAQKDNLGHTKRSSSKANKVGKGRAGALLVRDCTTGVEFEVGAGLTDADKDEWWAWWQLGPKRPQRFIKYKFFPVGMQEKPRHPVYLCIRNPLDF